MIGVCVHLKQLESIFVSQHRELFASALAITRNKAMAEDTVHEALMAVASLKEAPRDIAAYLFRVVRNKALHNNRQAGRFSPMDDDYLEQTSNHAEPNPEQDILIQQIKQHMGSLNMDEQQVLMLKIFEDMTFNDIARIMEASPNTVASWYRRGLEKLKELIRE